MTTRYIGIDISKDSYLAAYLEDNGRYRLATYPKTIKGIQRFIQSIDIQSHCVMEATGSYSMNLTFALSNQGYKVWVVNPKQISHFAKVMLAVTKTDKTDAKLIALYGQKMQPEPYRMPDHTLWQIKQKRVLLKQLKKQLRALLNVEGSFEYLPIQDQATNDLLRKSICFLQEQIQHLQSDMISLACQEYQALIDQITSVKGIGKQTAIALIEATEGFTPFPSAKKFAKFIGISPSYSQSGSSIKTKGVISRSGDPQLRSLLYMATWSAVKLNAACKALFKRLKANGKPGKVALMAVANKLIRQVFAVVKSGINFSNDYQIKLNTAY